MKRPLKTIIAALERGLALPLSLIPFALRRRLISGLIFVKLRIGMLKAALECLFALWDDMDLVINERATANGDGVDPKHRAARFYAAN